MKKQRELKILMYREEVGLGNMGDSGLYHTLHLLTVGLLKIYYAGFSFKSQPRGMSSTRVC